jgi:U3 small nucleolar RNA-associated protein 21
MTLGSPVTSLSLSPAKDMLATTHVNRRGIYLWSNQLIFGAGAGILPSDEPVRLRLPELCRGTWEAEAEAAGGGAPEVPEVQERDTGAGVSSSDDDSDAEVRLEPSLRA